MIKGAIDSINLEKTEKILEQMKKYICKVFGNKISTGFFNKVHYKNELIPVLITNFHIIDDIFMLNKKQIKICINNDYKIININKNSQIYSSSEYDIIIIKINGNEINNYLEIDQNIFLNDSESLYINESIYILHYPSGGQVSVSFGYGIDKINNYDIRHFCRTEICSSGGPIINLQNNKIIGIHKGFIHKKDQAYNIGTFLKIPLIELKKINNEIIMAVKVKKENINENKYEINNEFHNSNKLKTLNNEIIMAVNIKKENINENINLPNNELYNLNKIITKNIMKLNIRKDNLNEINNEIIMTLNITRENINENIYLLNQEFQNNFNKLNEYNTNLYINNNKMKYKNIFKPSNTGKYTIKIQFNVCIKNYEMMFSGCENIEKIDLLNFIPNEITNMRYMFSNCSSLISITGISNWDTKNVRVMRGMFSNCYSLTSIPNISNWDTKNVTDMSYMFFNCSSLISLPDISNWNTKNVTDMSFMFSNCNFLKSIPDISNWDINSVTFMRWMFSNCYSLKSIPDISKWNFNKLIDNFGMFDNDNKK